MGKNLAKRAAHEIVKDSSPMGWVVVVIAAIAIAFAWNPYGQTHHWVWMAVIFIVAAPIAAYFDRRGKKKRT